MRLAISITSILLILITATSAGAQKKKPIAVEGPPALTRTTTRHESHRFGYGGTLTIVGAPSGSITIEGWTRNQVDITADIELHANTEEDLQRLSSLNNFAIDEVPNHLSILTTGTHDKSFMRRVARKFPKTLVGLPWKIDYRIRVPALIDMDINAGRGAFNLSGVEGAITFKALQSDATMLLLGGTANATIGAGNVNVRLSTRSWRGSGVDLQLKSGDLNVELPAGFSGDINADILLNGRINNLYPSLESREGTHSTERSIKERAGAGGATLTFVVGEGTITIRQEGRKPAGNQ